MLKYLVKYVVTHTAVVWQHTMYAATPNILTTVTLAMPKYELPDDGRRPKHVGAF